MPQSLSAVYIHLVFSTKDRRQFLRDKPTRDALHSYRKHEIEWDENMFGITTVRLSFLR